MLYSIYIKPIVAVLTDFERGQKRKIDDLYKSALLEQERVILATDVARKDEADVEDFLEPELFVELVNKAYGLSDQHAGRDVDVPTWGHGAPGAGKRVALRTMSFSATHTIISGKSSSRPLPPNRD